MDLYNYLTQLLRFDKIKAVKIKLLFMALTEKDLGQIKEVLSEAMVSEQYKKSIKATVAEAMVSEPIKKVLKETMLEVMEPMTIASQKEFDKMDERFDKIDGQLNEMNERLIDLDKTNTQAHEDAGLRLNNVAYRFELVDLKKRVEVLEKKAATRA